MLASVRKGGKINEAEIPPPVASGNPVPPSAPPTSAASPPEHQEESDSAVETTPVSPENIAVPLLPVRISPDLKSFKFVICFLFFSVLHDDLVVSALPTGSESDLSRDLASFYGDRHCFCNKP